MPEHSDAAAALNWIKADLHVHTAEDPYDEVDYTALELLDTAHRLGFGALAITLHRKVFHEERAFARAKELGIVLIPAAELRIEGADAVLLNITPEEASRIRTFDDLRELRAQRGESLFVIAPHPYYVFGGSIGRRLDEYLDCFDAIEFCHFHIPLLNPNRRAARLAKNTGKPLLSTSDAHRRHFFGRNYSLVGVPASGDLLDIPAIFAAMRAHRVRRVNPPGGLPRFLAMMVFLFVVNPILRRLPGSKRTQDRKRKRLRQAGGSPLRVTVRPTPTSLL